jgi:hypothetical protein
MTRVAVGDMRMFQQRQIPEVFSCNRANNKTQQRASKARKSALHCQTKGCCD